MSANRLALAGALLCLAACHGSTKSNVLALEVNVAASGLHEIASLEVTISTMDGASQTNTFKPSGSAIAFPTSLLATLPLSTTAVLVTVVARTSDGKMVADGMAGPLPLEAGVINQVNVTLTGEANSDGGVGGDAAPRGDGGVPSDGPLVDGAGCGADDSPCSIGIFQGTCQAGVCVCPQGGCFAEFPLPTANSSGCAITAGPDGNLWFADDSANQIGRVTPTGVVTEFAIGPSTAGGPVGIAKGPDGNVWFTEQSNSSAVPASIAVITPSGTGMEFFLPAGGFATGLTAGPDGNLWFADAGANKIGSITPAGVIMEFAIADQGEQPLLITAGLDGNLWFSQTTDSNGVNNVGRITTSGVITEFPVPEAVQGIVAGPDGNLWLLENAANSIGRLTVSGMVTEFPIPTPGSNAYGITAGPDGNVWFTESHTGKIGRITPAGVFTEFNIPAAGTHPCGITAGPDGNIWFTGGDKIGVLKL